MARTFFGKKRRRIEKAGAFGNKRRKVYQSVDCSSLFPDLWRKIFNCLHVVEKLRFMAVCHSWRAIAKEEIKSFLSSSSPKSPLLLLPGDHQEEEDEDAGNSLGRMLSLEDTSFMAVKLPQDSHIVGSCRGGWILLMKKRMDLALWNPRFDIQIHLPSVLTFPCVKGDFHVSEHWITKAVLFGSDPLSSSDYGVVVMYGRQLAFAKCGASQWTDLGDAGKDYFDITSCFKDSILALSYSSKVEVWNFSTSIPKKTTEIRFPFPQDFPETKEHLRDKYVSQYYIVESKGNVFLVVRWVGNFVDGEGDLHTEDEVNEEYSYMVCPYMTKKFYVFKLDSEAKRLIHVDSLGDQTLFLGGNQSILLRSAEGSSTCKNSIYFTDDYWDRMDEHDYYGGHDMGVFSLEDGRVHEIFPFKVDKISPPFWVH